nr:MAG TPA: hypothetical protein [Caudoviricetes sp.]
MATYNNNKKSSVTLDSNRKRYALVAGNGIAILMSDKHRFRRFSNHNKNAIMNSLEALDYVLEKCPTNDTISELVIDIGIPNCIKGVFGASFRQYIRTQKFVGSGDIIPVYMLDKMKHVVKAYNDRNFNVNIYSLSLASVDEEMVKIKQRALDVLYKVQVEDSQTQPQTQSQPVQGFTQEQVNAMIQNAVAQALASVMGNPAPVQQQPVQQPIVEPVVEPVAQQIVEPAVEPVQQPVSTSAPKSQPVQSQVIESEVVDFNADDFTDGFNNSGEDPFAGFDEEIPF